MSGCQGSTFTGMQRNQIFRGKDSCHSNAMYSPNMLLRKFANSGSRYSNRRSWICTHSVTLLSENLLRTMFGSNTPLPTNLYPLITSLRIVCGQDHKGSRLGRRKIFVVFIPLSTISNRCQVPE